MNRNEIDAAEQALRDPKLRGNVAADIEIARLEKKIRDIKTRITSVTKDFFMVLLWQAVIEEDIEITRHLTK